MSFRRINLDDRSMLSRARACRNLRSRWIVKRCNVQVSPRADCSRAVIDDTTIGLRASRSGAYGCEDNVTQDTSDTRHWRFSRTFYARDVKRDTRRSTSRNGLTEAGRSPLVKLSPHPSDLPPYRHFSRFLSRRESAKRATTPIEIQSMTDSATARDRRRALYTCSDHCVSLRMTTRDPRKWS